jgi:ABC-type uncharacterized transport system substrate-binding protein
MLTIAIPKNVSVPTYDLLIHELKREKIKFDLLAIDFDQDSQQIQSQIDNEADILFVSGEYLAYTLKNLHLKNAKMVFLGVKQLHEKMFDDEQKRRSAGVFRAVDTNKLIQIGLDIFEGNTKPAFLYKNGSKLQALGGKFQESAKTLGVDLHLQGYDTSDDFDAIFANFKSQNITSCLLFPPSVAKDDIAQLVAMQQKYHIPIIAQKRSEIESGAMGGMVIDYDKIIPKLASFVQKIANGEDISKEEDLFVMPKNYINLNSALMLDTTISDSFLRFAEVVSAVVDNKNKNNSIDAPLQGNYCISISIHSPKLMVKRYLEALKRHGLEEDINFHINYIDGFKGGDYEKCDIIFATGNNFQQITSMKTTKPIVAITKREDVKKIDFAKRNITGAIRVSFDKITEMVISLGYKKIALIYSSRAPIQSSLLEMSQILKNASCEPKLYPYDSIEELEYTFSQMKNEGIELVVTFPSSTQKGDIEQMIKLQVEKSLPMFGHSFDDLKKGTLFATESDLEKTFDYMADVTRKILDGRDAAEFPFYFGDFFVIINLDTAYAMDLDLDPKILQANKVYAK